MWSNQHYQLPNFWINIFPLIYAIPNLLFHPTLWLKHCHICIILLWIIHQDQMWHLFWFFLVMLIITSFIIFFHHLCIMACKIIQEDECKVHIYFVMFPINNVHYRAIYDVVAYFWKSSQNIFSLLIECSNIMKYIIHLEYAFHQLMYIFPDNQ